MSPAIQASPDNIGPAPIFDALRGGLKKVILVSLLLAGLTYLMLTTIAPVFQSETELAIVAKSAVGRLSDPGRQAPPDSLTDRMDREAINTHVRSMRSGELLSSVAEELKLADRREFNAALGPIDTFESGLRSIGLGGTRTGDSERERVLSALRERIEVYAGKESSLIGIRVQSIDPELAAQIANTLAEKYRKLLAQLEENSKKLDTRAQPVEAKIVSKAKPASVPVFPKRASMSALIFVACMLIGTAWIVTKALFKGANTTAPSTLAPATDLHNREQHEPMPTGTSQYDDSDALPIARGKKKALTVSAGDALEPLQSLDDLRSRVELSRPKEGGYRIIIAGANQDIDASGEAVEVTKKLASEGRHVILIDWCPLFGGLADKLDMPRVPGMNDLLLGKSSFEDIVVRMHGSDAHFIASGTALPEDGPDIDPDLLNLVLDALDEAYDHIVVTGNHDDARSLFETIQGRFDAAIVVDDKSRRSSVINDPLHTFLGFEVIELDVINFEAEKAGHSSGLQRILRTSKVKSSDYPTLN